MSGEPVFGGVEAGGTKFMCIVASGPDRILSQTQFPTTTPSETLGRTIQFFKNQASPNLTAIGIGSFGPVDLDLSSSSYGHITTTPKPGWAHTDMISPLEETFGIPIAFNTDVNAAAYGEYLWGAAQDLDAFIYLTIGTGIGGGGMLAGELLSGLIHPEMGHIRIPHDPQKDPFPGICPYHADCFEGLASGPAVQARWGLPAEEIPKDHPAWDLEADYIAFALHNFITTLSPQRIILGGGLMHQQQLFHKVRKKTTASLNNYVHHPAVKEAIESYIVPPALGDRAGVLGAAGLALQAYPPDKKLIAIDNEPKRRGYHRT